MGISGKPEELIDVERVKQAKIPVIKRFSGGGTVIVDENTLFITFILSKKDMDVEAFPEPILRWSADLYEKSWQIPHFKLRENDYCIGEKKCGGNAQYIKKDRWLHHTSFLWDYKEENMGLLLLPAKRPKYRKDRRHQDFLCKLKDHADSRNELIERLKQSIVKQLYISDFDVSTWQPEPHRMSAHLIDL
jgi:lipoate-protein ligase A